MIDDLGQAQCGESDLCKKNKTQLCSTRPAHVLRQAGDKEYKQQCLKRTGIYIVEYSKEMCTDGDKSFILGCLE